MRFAAICIAAVLAAGVAAAETSPYSGWETRPIKGLSEKDIADLRAGRGMSLALPAELNGYPGPRHVLDLSEQLALTPEQKARTEALFDAMQRRASAVGEQVLEAEARLDRLFTEEGAEPDAVQAATTELGALYGELRFVHLRYHIAMKRILAPTQVAAYQRLRGYGSGGSGHGHGSGHGGH